MEVIGKIEWINEEPKEFNNQMSIGIKVNGTFYNKYDEEEVLESVLNVLKKGYEVKLQVDERNVIESLEVLSDEVKEESNFTDDMISFEDLLKEGHNQGLKSVDSEVISCDFEKNTALVKVTIETRKGTFKAHGDATKENCKSSMIVSHFLRMAETRGLARALRFATNNAKTAKEEI